MTTTRGWARSTARRAGALASSARAARPAASGAMGTAAQRTIASRSRGAASITSAGFVSPRLKSTRMTAARMRLAISRKRDGEALAASLWAEIVAAHVAGLVDDAQLAALLMACFLRGLEPAETEALTRAMVASGETLEPAAPNCVDKHSTGGVGDAVSLIVVPLVAACGVPVGKLSGGALGHTGGTLDKLRAVEGVRVELSPEEFAAQIRAIGCAIAAPGCERR